MRVMDAIYEASNPDLRAFRDHGGKLMIIQGWHDDGTSFSLYTIDYYEMVQQAMGGPTATKAFARLFMVPGMAHCGGGAGPNSFDSIAAIESWVEKGHAPASIVATKFDDDDPSGKVVRSMPLCPFPAMAHYQGKGDVNDAANWSCPATDRRLLRKGHAGQMAGLYADLK